MDSAAIKRLEDFQNSIFKNLLAVPHSVPTPSLRSELGCLVMEESIDKRNLNCLFHVKNLQTSSLANEIYRLQLQYNFPGLVEECRKLIVKYNLPNIIDEDLNLSEIQWE